MSGVMTPHASAAPGNIAEYKWRNALLWLGLSALAIIALFAADVRDMVTIWLTASTYNHCALIPFISGWLAWQRRDEVAHVSPSQSLAGLWLTAAGAGLWLLGDVGGVAVARQTGVVLMIQSLVPLFLGMTLSRALLFPIAYLPFMVPIGEELLPILQTLTAEMSMALLAVAGIPAHIEGIFITTPNGYYKVAEACAGVKFLVAMLAYGALAAHICFRGWGRRLAFMAACVVFPILANGVRAFATMYVGYLTTADSAAGFDHVLYGWFFFAIVMIAVMAMGWPFFDRKLSDPWLSKPLVDGDAPVRQARFAPAVAAAIVLAPVALSQTSAAIGQNPMPSTISLPEVEGWTRVEPKSIIPWAPNYANADHLVLGHYADEQGRIVDLAIVLYAWQDEGREMIGYGKGAAGLDAKGWVWSSAGPMIANAHTEYLTAPGAVRRLAATTYFAGGAPTGSALRVKIATTLSRLTGRDQAVAAVIVSAQDRDGFPAEDAVRAFVQTLGPVDVLAQKSIAEARR